MGKKFGQKRFGAEFVSRQIWCYLISRREDPKVKVAQNSLKHRLVLEFLKSNEIFENFVNGHDQSIKGTNAQTPH